ncbi:hypothetical protein OEK97_27915, partial [Escherichia coli]|uniref:hypothetical protein n=1 Tax=Escherichia coli TaxID=562 RepID=UPI0021DAFED8
MQDPIASLGDIQGILRFALSYGHVASIPSNSITPLEFKAMATINGIGTSTFASAPEEYRDPYSVLRRAKGNVIYYDNAPLV